MQKHNRAGFRFHDKLRRSTDLGVVVHPQFVHVLVRPPQIAQAGIVYATQGRLAVERLGRGFAWLDAGTYDSLVEAAEFIRVLQRRQGQLIAAPEEVAFHNGWIDADELRAQAAKFNKSQYGARLLDNLRT